MYSDRPRRPRHNRGGQAHQSASSQVKEEEEEEEDAGKASINELGRTISDTLKFATLSINVSPPALDSTDGAVVHAGDIGSGLPDSTIMTSPAAEEALSPGSEERREDDSLPNTPTFDSVDDAFEYFFISETAAQAARDKALTLSRQASLEKFEAQQVLIQDQARQVAGQESSAVAAQGR